MKLHEATEPFPHWVIKGFWRDDLLSGVVSEIPASNDPRWQRFNNSDERKMGMSDPSAWGPATSSVMIQMLHPDFCAYLTSLTGIPELIGKTEGGGVHLIKPGGVLGTHVDFNRASDDGMYRRLNCLLYLNRGWTDADGGHLELRHRSDDPDPAVRILPEANTMVVFQTSESSWHGHPTPLPGPRDRLSLACYFYTVDPPEGVGAPHTTIFAR